MFGSLEEFPPSDLVDAWAARATDKTLRLERLYHNTRDYSWDARAVLDELEEKHGGIKVPEDKREALGHLFAVLVWGELAAWNIAADLARTLPDVDAKMAATGQVFDEARHFAVLREYLRRAGIDLPRLNPYGRRTLQITLATGSVIEKLYGMQLTVENLAVAIFKRVQAAKVEPVLTDLLAYVERDESRHVALGVLYLPRLLGRATPLQRLSNWRFNMEIFLLTMAGGELLDPHLEALGIDHRELGSTVMNMHRQVLRRMEEEEGLAPGSGIKGVYSLTAKQNRFLLDFLHPDKAVDRSPRQRFARDLFHRATVGVARILD